MHPGDPFISTIKSFSFFNSIMVLQCRAMLRFIGLVPYVTCLSCFQSFPLTNYAAMINLVLLHTKKMGLSPGQLRKRRIARLHVSAFVTMSDLIMIPAGLTPTNTPTSNPWEGLFPVPLPTQLIFIFHHWQSDRKNKTIHFRSSCLCICSSLYFI